MMFSGYRLICELTFTVCMFRKILIIKKKRKAYPCNWLRFRNRYFYFKEISCMLYRSFCISFRLFSKSLVSLLQRLFVTLTGLSQELHITAKIKIVNKAAKFCRNYIYMLFSFINPEDSNDDFAFTKTASRENLEKTGEQLKSGTSLRVWHDFTTS